MQARSLLLTLAALLSLAAPASPLGFSEVPPEVGVGVHAVAIEGFLFHPQVLVVGLGSKVTWTNLDDDAHTATDLTARWSTDALEHGDAGSVTFDAPGTYVYFCVFHSTMYGVLVVAAEP